MCRYRYLLARARELGLHTIPEKVSASGAKKEILTESEHRVIIHKDNTVYRELYAKLWSLERFSTMERIKTIATRDLTKSVVTGGCGECQTSCQSACKTSCGVANQQCENSNK